MANTAQNPQNPYPMIIIGIPESMVPKTGINPNINTISERVKINGKVFPTNTHHMIRSPTMVKREFASAMIDCALNIAPKLRLILLAMIAYS